MASSVPFKVYHSTESSEPQGNVKSTRKSARTLAVLQKTAGDKENLVGRQPAYIAKEKLMKVTSEVLQTPDTKRTNPIDTATTSSQTSPSVDVINKKDEITYEDLTSEQPSEHYWRALTKKRETAIIETKAENQQLIERIATLEFKLTQAKERLAEAKSLAEVLTELLEEKESVQNAAVTTEADQHDQSASI